MDVKPPVLKCAICGICNDKVITFSQERLERCKFFLTVRNTRNLKYRDITLPDTPNDIEGYHAKCYSSFTAIPKAYYCPIAAAAKQEKKPPKESLIKKSVVGRRTPKLTQKAAEEKRNVEQLKKYYSNLNYRKNLVKCPKKVEKNVQRKNNTNNSNNNTKRRHNNVIYLPEVDNRRFESVVIREPHINSRMPNRIYENGLIDDPTHDMLIEDRLQIKIEEDLEENDDRIDMTNGLSMEDSMEGNTMPDQWNNSTDENSMKLYRIRRLIQQDEELANLKTAHLKAIQQMEMEHLKQKQILELKAATAASELAELLLAEKQKQIRNEGNP